VITHHEPGQDLAVIGVIVIVAIAFAVVFESGYFNSASVTTVDELCTVISYSRSYSDNPNDNTTLTSALQTYTLSNVQVQSSLSNSTATGSTLTYSGRPGIAWNETICTYYTSIP
jgi:hypothetical protein